MGKTEKNGAKTLPLEKVKEILDYRRYHAEIDGKPTFLTVLVDHFAELAQNWNLTTQEQYLNHYRQHIVPLLNERALIDYDSVDFFDAVILSLSEKKKQRKNNRSTCYSESTLQHFRRLIKVVIEAAAKAGICPDILWGSLYSLPAAEKAAKRLETERVILRKSLTPAEEWRVCDYLLRDFREDGERVGLLMMLILGLRNEESAGLNFGDIVSGRYADGLNCVCVWKSTEAGGNQLKTGGKTRNMYRVLPLHDAVYDFLMQRRKHIQDLIATGKIQLNEGECIDDLPLVCVDRDWKRRCSSAKLTNAGRRMFQEIRLKENQLAYIAEELEKEGDPMGRYKDPTANLLRRNLATHLQILGFSVEQMQYYMGHDIEDSVFDRGDFLVEQQMLEMKRKLEKRAIIGSEWDRSWSAEVPGSGHCFGDQISKGEAILHLSGRDRLIHYQVKEPDDVVRLELKLRQEKGGSDQIPYRVFQAPSDREGYDSWANVLENYWRKYRSSRRTLRSDGTEPGKPFIEELPERQTDVDDASEQV